MTENENDKGLTKLQKLAHLFVILGPETSAPLLKQFDEGTLVNVCREMAHIKFISASLRQSLLEEFSNIIVNNLDDVVNDANLVQKTLALTKGDETARTLFSRALQAPACSQVTQLVESIDPIQLCNTLQDEQEQTIASLLACLPPSAVSRLLSHFPQEKRVSILLQMGTMGPISTQCIEQLLGVLKKLCAPHDNHTSLSKRKKAIEGGPVSVANILNTYEKEIKQQMLAFFEKKNAPLTKAIQKYLFTFEDLVKLSNFDLQKILREVDNNDLIMSLKAAPAELFQCITNAMSKRAAETLQEEISNLGPQRVKTIEAARQKIIDVVYKLEAQDQLNLDQNQDEILL